MEKLKSGTITLDYSNYACDIFEDYDCGKGIGVPIALKGDKFTSISFEGLNEGEGGAYKDDEVAGQIKRLMEKHKDYSIKVIDNRIKQQTLSEVSQNGRTHIK